MTIFEMSLSAGIFIIGIIIIRIIFKAYLPKKTFMALWGFAIIRLLLPISMPSQANIFSILSKTTLKPNSIATGDLSNINLVAGAVANWGTQAIEARASEASPSMVIWLFGAIAVATWFIYTHIKHCENYKSSLPLETSYVKAWKISHKTSNKIEIKYSDKIETPLTYGVISPMILIPKSQCENECELELILTHEYTHIKNLDILTKYLLAICLSIHWFNPLVWLMYILASRDIEIVCDEEVVKGYSKNGLDIRSIYAKILLNLEEKRQDFSPFVSAFSKKPMEERIISIMKIKKNTAFAGALAVIVVLSAVTLFATQKEDNSLDDKAIIPSSAPKSSDNQSITVSQPSEPNGIASSSTAPTAPIAPIADDKLIEEEIPFEVTTADENAPEFALPITDVKVTNGFGGVVNHSGVDFIADEGTEIYAIADGTVVYSQMTREDKPDMPPYGNYIVIDHGNGYKSLYAHCSKLVAKKGDEVKKGDLIARVGMTGMATGDHLHLEMRLNGKYLDPSLLINTINFKF